MSSTGGEYILVAGVCDFDKGGCEVITGFVEVVEERAEGEEALYACGKGLLELGEVGLECGQAALPGRLLH